VEMGVRFGGKFRVCRFNVLCEVLLNVSMQVLVLLLFLVIFDR